MVETKAMDSFGNADFFDKFDGIGILDLFLGIFRMDLGWENKMAL